MFTVWGICFEYLRANVTGNSVFNVSFFSMPYKIFPARIFQDTIITFPWVQIQWIFRLFANKWIQIGYGGPINSFLSWGLFTGVARLTYMFYLIHLDVIFMFFYSRTYTIQVSLMLVVSIWTFLYFLADTAGIWPINFKL